MSTVLLFLGLQIQTSPGTDFSYYPYLPVDFLKSSNVGGSIVDAFLGGILTSSYDPDVSEIQLHPFAIAGYTGLIINALNLLPLGNTDGGRVSQALFGRQGASVIQGLTYTLMLLASLFGSDSQKFLVAYSLLCIFVQGDMEIPMRNEIDAVSRSRLFFAIGIWFAAGLTLLPM